MILVIVDKQKNLKETFISVTSLKADGNIIEINVGIAYSRRLIKYILDNDISLVNNDEGEFVTSLAIHYFDGCCVVIINNNPRFSLSLS